MSALVYENRNLFGGKAAVLLELHSAGFRVPPFVVLTTDDITTRVVAESLRPTSLESSQDTQSTRVSLSDLPQVVDRLGFPLAVRSSASVEDGAQASFAGQFSSFLNLSSYQDVESAVRRCHASASSSSVTEYCRRHDVPADSVQMQIIVQRMVQPQLAGVAFTVNPMTGAEEVVIEACTGVADELLAGHEPALPDDHPLVQQYAKEITATALAIQRHYGAPQDIEFAIEDDLLYILQARPITRISFSAAIGEWTNADFRDGGVSSTVCSPLMWSLYDFIWDSTLKGCLSEIKLLSEEFQAGRMFFGRPYWNLGALKQCLVKIPGFVEREFDTDLSVQIDYDGDGIRTPFTLLGLLRILPTAVAIRSFLKKQTASADAYLETQFEPIERRYESLPSDIDSTFRTLIEHDFFAVESSYFRTIFALSLAKMDFKMSFPDADYPSLVAALPDIQHFAPIQKLREMKRTGETDVTSFLREFRHHYRQGLDLRQPRWDEDSAFVEQLLEELPDKVPTDPRPAYEQARAETVQRLPAWKRRSFNRKLDRLRHFVWLREEMRDLSGRMYYIIRRHVLAIAKKRGIGDDIFFMTFREIFDDDRSRVKHNRAIFESYRNFQAPNEIGRRFTFENELPTGALTGIGASPGTVRGRVCLARTVDEAMRASEGEILVCPFTDPGWTPVLNRVAGVVTETGGLLSHAAVICREYGIPAVLGIPSACQRIPDGSTVVLDGSAGHVEVMETEKGNC